MRKSRTITSETYITDLSSFIESVEMFDMSKPGSTMVFRGQSVQGNLLPSIARGVGSRDTHDNELEMIEQLQLMGAGYFKEFGDSVLDLLVAAQHFGLKTRLLDWTTNPLVALWFACSSRKEGDVYVYALDATSFRNKNIYQSDPFKLTKTCVFQPRLNNPRIIAQHGWFTVHKYSTRDKKFVALEKNGSIKSHLTQFEIAGKFRDDILVSLDKYGINSKTLFPDLEGLCKHLNWKHCSA